MREGVVVFVAMHMLQTISLVTVDLGCTKAADTTTHGTSIH